MLVSCSLLKQCTFHCLLVLSLETVVTEWTPGGMVCWSKVASETNGSACERHKGFCGVACQDGQRWRISVGTG